VVLTHELDFGAILGATGGGKPSVAQLRTDDLRPETIGSIVVKALQAAREEIEAGALVTINPNKTRIRILPLLDVRSKNI